MTGYLQHILPFLAVTLPLLLAPVVFFGGARLAALTPLAALAALGYALFGVPGPSVELPWLLLDTRLGLTDATRVFLLFTAFLWIIAGFYARSYLAGDLARRRFFAFYLLTMSGNLGLILARDAATFYLFFTLMSFAAYGLIVHDGTEKARWAGKVYLILVVIGEALLLPGVLLAVAAAGTTELADLPAGVSASRNLDLIVGLILAGFGVKAGALPLHVWLPLAHPAAPTPASAVLSGAMIKAGLLGWILFLPLGEADLPVWGALCVAAGLAAAFYGVLVGLTQKNPKTILAYSSISQMGFMTVGLGASLVAPQARSLALAAILLYAAHHALAKGALFLGVGVSEKAGGVWQRRLVVAGLLLAALALAGAPLTSGAAAKAYLKAAKEPLPAPWPEVLKDLLQVGAVGTTLLMGRFLFSSWPKAGNKSPEAGLWLPWLVLLIAVATLVLTIPESVADTLGLVFSFSALWPAAVGALLVLGAWLLVRRRGAGLGPRLPEGDLLVPATRLLSLLKRVWQTHLSSIPKRSAEYLVSLAPSGSVLAELWSVSARLEYQLRYWTVAGGIFLLLTVILLALIVLTQG